jgi:hypothetical protein
MSSKRPLPHSPTEENTIGDRGVPKCNHSFGHYSKTDGKTHVVEFKCFHCHTSVEMSIEQYNQMIERWADDSIQQG